MPKGKHCLAVRTTGKKCGDKRKERNRTEIREQHQQSEQHRKETVHNIRSQVWLSAVRLAGRQARQVSKIDE
jgi:hypothetical protein